MKTLIKVYVEKETAAKLKTRAGRESLSSFVNGLIESYFAEYPGLSAADKKLMEVLTPKVGQTLTIKMPERLQRSCSHGVISGYHCWQCGGIAQI